MKFLLLKKCFGFSGTLKWINLLIRFQGDIGKSFWSVQHKLVIGVNSLALQLITIALSPQPMPLFFPYPDILLLFINMVPVIEEAPGLILNCGLTIKQQKIHNIVVSLKILQFPLHLELFQDIPTLLDLWSSFSVLQNLISCPLVRSTNESTLCTF